MLAAIEPSQAQTASIVVRDVRVAADDGAPGRNPVRAAFAGGTPQPLTVRRGPASRRYYARSRPTLPSGAVRPSPDYRDIGSRGPQELAVACATGILDVPCSTGLHASIPAGAIHWVGWQHGGLPPGSPQQPHLVARQLNIARSAATGGTWWRRSATGCGC